MGTEPLRSLPLPLDMLPEALRRFCDPAAPTRARMMAAKGMVPVRGHDQVTLLVQLSADEDESVRSSAHAKLSSLPDKLLLPACQAPLPASILDALAEQKVKNEAAMLSIVGNAATHDETLERVARNVSEAACERIATNEQRLLGAPGIIEALYKNPATRMSTSDRLIELAVRNGVTLSGIPAFKAVAEAIQGQLIPEPTGEPLPSDTLFQESLSDDDDDPEAIERDRVDGSEALKDKYKPLAMRVAEMSTTEKLRLAMVGNAAARSLLARDRNKQVAMSAVTSPKFTLKEAIEIANSRAVDEAILRYIGNKKDWLRNGEFKRALVFNPKTPVGISLRFLSHMRLNDLRALMKSKGVAAQIKAASAQHVQRRERAGQK